MWIIITILRYIHIFIKIIPIVILLRNDRNDWIKKKGENIIVYHSDVRELSDVDYPDNNDIETRSELWNSEKELLNYYRRDENFQLLKKGKIGGNLIFKYKTRSLVVLKNEWIEFLQQQLYEVALEKTKTDKEISDKLQI